MFLSIFPYFQKKKKLIMLFLIYIENLNYNEEYLYIQIRTNCEFLF